MSYKIIEAASSEGISLSESDGERINAFLGITDKRKNLSDSQKLILKQVCELVLKGESVQGAIARMGSRSGSVSSNSVVTSASAESTDEADLNPIILEQANYAADAALMGLPNLAKSEMESLRQVFITQFRKRIREQLQSVEYQSAFVTTIDSHAQLPATDTASNTVETNGLLEEG